MYRVFRPLTVKCYCHVGREVIDTILAFDQILVFAAFILSNYCRNMAAHHVSDDSVVIDDDDNNFIRVLSCTEAIRATGQHSSADNVYAQDR